MELKQIGKKTYIIEGINKTGIYLIDETNVVIIDTGLDDKSGQEIIDICQEQNWTIKMIVNTHCHTDHIGGNYFIQQKLNVPIYAKGLERIIIQNQEIAGAMAYGGYPYKYLQNKYLMAKNTNVEELNSNILPQGLEIIDLPGHNAEMIGFKTSDNIYFLADAVAGENVITKYKLQFMYNLADYFTTLDYIAGLNGELFVPSHGDIFKNNKDIVNLNKKVALENIEYLKLVCKESKSFEQILKEVFNDYHLKMELIQYTFISSTLKGYLSYMINNDLLRISFVNNELLWETL